LLEKGDAVALLTFDKWQDLIKFTKVASENKLKLSGPRTLAKEVLRLQSPSAPDKVQPLDPLLIDVLKDLIDDCKNLPLVGQKDAGKDISTLRMNLLDHLQLMPNEESSDTSKLGTGQVLVTAGGQIKLIQEIQPTESYPFSNYPVKVSDEVHLSLSNKDAIFLVQKISVTDPCLAPLYERLASDFNGNCVYVSYVDALGATQVLLKSAVK
jgi:hypothetical protein